MSHATRYQTLHDDGHSVEMQRVLHHHNSTPLQLQSVRASSQSHHRESRHVTCAALSHKEGTQKTIEGGTSAYTCLVVEDREAEAAIAFVELDDQRGRAPGGELVERLEAARLVARGQETA